MEYAAKLLEHIGMNDHAIELGEGKQPLFGSIYSLDPIKLETLKTYIKTNLANSFIWPFKSLARALILFDKKLDKNFHLCIDYWGLNNLTIKNRYLLPLVIKSLDQCGWAKQFTQLDLTNIYHQIRIYKGDEWKMAFKTQYGHFKYQVMSFGLSNTLATFQRYVNKILAEKLDIFVIVYLDDILIHTKDLDQLHIEAIYWILDQLQKYLLFANLKKYYFYQNEVCFLGYVLLSKSISIEVEKIKIVRK